MKNLKHTIIIKSHPSLINFETIMAIFNLPNHINSQAIMLWDQISVLALNQVLLNDLSFNAIVGLML